MNSDPPTSQAKNIAGPPLLRSFKDSKGDMEVRHAAAIGLGNLRYRRAIPALSKALRTDRDAAVRAAAASALGQFDREVPALLQSLSDVDELPWVRAQAADSLGAMAVHLDHDPRTIDGVVDALDDPELEVRFFALYAVGQIGQWRLCRGTNGMYWHHKLDRLLRKVALIEAEDDRVLTTMWSVRKEARDIAGWINRARAPQDDAGDDEVTADTEWSITELCEGWEWPLRERFADRFVQLGQLPPGRSREAANELDIRASSSTARAIFPWLNVEHRRAWNGTEADLTALVDEAAALFASSMARRRAIGGSTPWDTP